MGKQTKNQEAQRRRRLELEAPVEPIRIDTSVDVEEEEREPLFYIDGDEYTIPKTVPADFTVRYMNNVQKHGSEFAVAQAMADLLGHEAMDALSDCPQMTDEHLRGIMKIISRKMMAAADKHLGN